MLKISECQAKVTGMDWNGLEWAGMGGGGRVLAGSNLNVFDCLKHSDNLDEIGTSASKQKRLLRVCESNISFY